jgi:hypothetical protein
MILNLMLLFAHKRQMKLVEYKNAHDGDCNVSRNDKLWKLLGRWVHDQRGVLGPQMSNANASQRDKRRIERLKALDFKWSAKKEATPSTHKSAGNGLCFPSNQK